MKAERFFVSLFMINLLLAISLVYNLKSDVMLGVFEDIFHSRKATAGFMAFSPNILSTYGFRTDPDDVKRKQMDSVFAETPIKHQDLDKLATLPPLDRSIMITKLFSTMGDGNCMNGRSLVDKINGARKKLGCSEDYAEIFSVLADYTGLKTRLVHNNLSYGVEVYDGHKWFFIDPYFAIYITNQEAKPLSYVDVAMRTVHGKWLKYNFFGGKNHCMSGKSVSQHPDYADTDAFTSVYALMGNNVISIIDKESKTPLQPKFVYTFAPYRDIKPSWAHVSITNGSTMELRRIAAGGLVLWVLLFIFADAVMPIYFIYSRFFSRKRIRK